MTSYEERVIMRGKLHYLVGLFVRWRARRRMDKMIRTLRKSGAKIGERVSLTPHCLLGGGGYLMIGDCCSLQDVEIDARAPVKIGNHVIIGDRAHILTNSHDIDDPEWTQKSYGIEIEDYVWIATKAFVLPSCRHIGRGAVIGAGAVVAKDVPPMAVVVGNPARILRYRKCVHESIVVEAFLGGDYEKYRETRAGKELVLRIGERK